MVGGRPVGEGDVGARQQEPGEIDTNDDCSGLARRAMVEGQVIGGLSLSL